MKKEYKLEEINFDEEGRTQIDLQFAKYDILLRAANLNLLIETDNDEIRLLSRKVVRQFARFKESANVLLVDNPKLRYSFEFNNLVHISDLAKKHLEVSDNYFTRIDCEVNKIFVREKTISTYIKHSEFKKIYIDTLESVPIKDLENISYSEFFLETSIRWLISKSGFEFNLNDVVQLKGFRHVDEEVFKWVSQKMFSNFIRTKFSINVLESRLSHKQIVSKADDLGKKLKLNPYESILFEASLSGIRPEAYMQGVKFKFPEIIGTEYQALSKYVVSNFDIKLFLKLEQISINLPISVAMLKAQIPKTVRNFKN